MSKPIVFDDFSKSAKGMFSLFFSNFCVFLLLCDLSYLLSPLDLMKDDYSLENKLTFKTKAGKAVSPAHPLSNE